MGMSAWRPPTLGATLMRLCCQGRLPLLPEQLARFHRDPENLRLLMAGWPGFRLLGHDGSVREGGVLRVLEHVGIVPLAMFFRHTLCEPPHRFRDEMIHGPFRHFIHTQEFLDAPGGSLRRETVDLSLPLVFGGAQVLRRVVAPRVQRVLEFRARAIAGLARNGALNREETCR